MFSCEFYQISKNTFSTELLWKTASVKRKVEFYISKQLLFQIITITTKLFNMHMLVMKLQILVMLTNFWHIHYVNLRLEELKVNLVTEQTGSSGSTL